MQQHNKTPPGKLPAVFFLLMPDNLNIASKCNIMRCNRNQFISLNLITVIHMDLDAAHITWQLILINDVFNQIEIDLLR